MAKFIELTKNEEYRKMDDSKVVVNCDRITCIEPNGKGCWVRFGASDYIVSRESFEEVCELIELATRDTIKSTN